MVLGTRLQIGDQVLGDYRLRMADWVLRLQTADLVMKTGGEAADWVKRTGRLEAGY